MSLPSIFKVTLRQGLSQEDIQDTFNEISLVDGLSGIETSSTLENVLYCGSDGEETVEQQLRKLPNVASVSFLPRP